MVKRAASQPVEAKAKKEAKKELAPAPAPVDPFLEELAPILALLTEAGDELSSSSKEMLQAMAPFCLRVLKEERHDYQNQMVEVLERTLKGVEAERECSVAAAQTQVDEAEAAKASSAQVLAEAEAKVQEQEQEKASKDATQQKLEAGAAEASRKLCAEQEREKSLSNEQSQILEEKTNCQQFMAEKWELLKAGSFNGKEWRERNKTIDTTLAALAKMGLDLSLKAALPTALKTKPSERGTFALKAVEFSEVVMNNFVKGLEEKIANFAQEAASRAEATAAAQEALTAAEGQLEAGKTAAAAAQESLDSAIIVHSDAEVAAQAAPKQAEAAAASLEEQRLLFESAKAVVGTFVALKEKSPTVAPAAEESVSPEQEELKVPAAVEEPAAAMEQIQGEAAAVAAPVAVQ